MSAAPNKETIYIDLEDEITTIIDKISDAKNDIVALVLPKRTSVLQSVVNMRLLKRASESAGKKVVLITSEAGLLPLAGAVGIHVAKSLQSKPEIPSAPKADAATKAEDELETLEDNPVESDDKMADLQDDDIDGTKAIGELAASAATDEPETIALDDPEDEPKKDKKTDKKADKPKKDKKLSVPNFDRFRLLLIAGIGGLILLIVFLVLAIKVLPKATITIQTDSTPISANFTASTLGSAKTLDEAGLVVPSSLKTNKQTANQQAPATGQQDLGSKATGAVSIKNCGDDPVSIPAGTGVSSGGLTFITQKSLQLDQGNFDSHGVCRSSGSHVDSTTVVAQAAGSQYNIAPSTFTVSGFSSVSGNSSNAMSGGTTNVVTVVAQADVDAAKAKFDTTGIANNNKTFASQQSSSGAYLLTSTATTTDPIYSISPAVGQQASTVTVTQTVTYTVLAVQKADLQKLITAQLNKQIDTKRQQVSPGDPINGATIDTSNPANPTDLSLTISKTTTAVPIINTVQVATQSVGKKSGDITSMISNWPGVKGVDVKMSPFWVSKAPKGKNKVHVILQQVKSTK